MAVRDNDIGILTIERGEIVAGGRVGEVMVDKDDPPPKFARVDFVDGLFQS